MKFKHPSANSLVVFNVVSTHLSFTRASEELKTSRVAVSSQIKQLETQLGTPLFLRQHRGLRLTEAGKTLAEAVAPSLRTISRTLDRLSNVSADTQLSISASHGMSSHWLMPRLHRFRALHREVDFRFHITDAYIDPETEGVDIALRYGDGPWPNVTAKRLIQVERFIVCSPTYLGHAGPLTSLDDLARHTLLHLSGHYGRLTRWQDWLSALGFDGGHTQPGLTFNDHNSLIEAVLAGEGLALAGPPQISDYLKRGMLVRVLEQHATMQRHFWSVRPKHPSPKPVALAFEHWLEEEMRKSASILPSAGR